MKKPLLIASAGLAVLGAAGALYGAFRKAEPWYPTRPGPLKPRHPIVSGFSGPMANGLLLQALRVGNAEAVRWSTIDAPDLDLRLRVTSDALKGSNNLRLPVSYEETIEACRLLDPGEVIAPSKRLCDAIYAAAPVKTVFHSLVTPKDPDSGGVKMASLEFVKKFNEDVNGQIGSTSELTAGAWKFWILSPRLGELAEGSPAAVNYGGWDAKGKPLQSPGARHNRQHVDYSQLVQPLRRRATRISTGEEVDLLDWIEREEKVPAKFTEVFR